MSTSKEDTAWVVSECSIVGFLTVEDAKEHIEQCGGVLFTDREEAENKYYDLRRPENFFWEP